MQSCWMFIPKQASLAGARVACCHSSPASLCTGDMWDVVIIGSCVLLSAAIAGAHTASADWWENWCGLWRSRDGAMWHSGHCTVWRAGGSHEDGEYSAVSIHRVWWVHTIQMLPLRDRDFVKYTLWSRRIAAIWSWLIRCSSDIPSSCREKVLVLTKIFSYSISFLFLL